MASLDELRADLLRRLAKFIPMEESSAAATSSLSTTSPTAPVPRPATPEEAPAELVMELHAVPELSMPAPARCSTECQDRVSLFQELELELGYVDEVFKDTSLKDMVWDEDLVDCVVLAPSSTFQDTNMTDSCAFPTSALKTEKGEGTISEMLAEIKSMLDRLVIKADVHPPPPATVNGSTVTCTHAGSDSEPNPHDKCSMVGLNPDTSANHVTKVLQIAPVLRDDPGACVRDVDTGMSAEVLTHIGGVSLFQELELDSVDEVFNSSPLKDVLWYEELANCVVTHIGRSSLFLEQIMGTHHELEGEINKPARLEHGVSGVRVVSLVVPSTEGKLQQLRLREMQSGTNMAVFSMSWDSGGCSVQLNCHATNVGLDMNHENDICVDLGERREIGNRLVLDRITPWDRSAFSPGKCGMGSQVCAFEEVSSWRRNALRPRHSVIQGDHFLLESIQPWRRNAFSPGKSTLMLPKEKKWARGDLQIENKPTAMEIADKYYCQVQSDDTAQLKCCLLHHIRELTISTIHGFPVIQPYSCKNGKSIVATEDGCPAVQLSTLPLSTRVLTSPREGFGFLSFADHATADQVLQSYNGQKMPKADINFRLNEKHADAPEKRTDDNRAIYVGDLSYDVTDSMLHNVFKDCYPSVTSASVVPDGFAGRSKGYGFVVFGDGNERREAMTEMNGAYCSTRPMRIRPATDSHTQWTDSEYDQSNERLFVGGLDLNVTDEDLKRDFSPYGELTAKVIEGKSYGFVTYTTRVSAEEAMIILKGSQLGDNAIRVICARLVSNKQDEANDGIPWDPGGVHGSGVQRNCLGDKQYFLGPVYCHTRYLGQVGLDVMGHGPGNGWAVDGNKRRSYTGRRASKNRN